MENHEKIIQYIIIVKEYKFIVNILIEKQISIQKNENILFFNKQKCLKILNGIIIKLNNTYKQSILTITNMKNNNNNINKNDNCDSGTSHDGTDEDSNISDDNIINEELFGGYLSILNENEINNLHQKVECLYECKKNFIFNKKNKLLLNNPFKKIKKMIINLSKITGFTNINELICLEFNIIDSIHLLNEKLIFMNKIFVPIDYNLVINSKTNQNDIKITKNFTNHLILFNNKCDIEFKINRKIIKITGFIYHDNLNICMKTSQLSNNFLYETKKNFEKIIEQNCENKLSDFHDLQNVNKDFATTYLKYMTTIEYLIYDNEYFIGQLITDYKTFIELKEMSISKMIDIYTKDISTSLYSVFNMLKLLLMGTKEMNNTGNLLFNLLKSKKNNEYDTFISTVIYNQLNCMLQIRLNNSSLNIKNEIDKIKNINLDDIDITNQVLLTTNMPNNIKKICLNKISELENSTHETSKIKMYVSMLINYPWLSENDDLTFKMLSIKDNSAMNFLNNIENKLNSEIFGHKKSKTKILQTLGKLISSQNNNIQPIAFVGPPGVGKTQFAQCLAEGLNMPFVQITLGGQNDGEVLHGHGYTYVGAQPGMIVKKMIEAGSARCVMYFDELDKCSSKNGQINELMSILIHLTDPMTNKSFQDRFFQDVAFPLNKVFFIFSFNDVNKIDKILLDRLELLEISNYSVKEKITIATDFLLKKILNDYNFEHNSVYFSNEILTFIIENYTYEAGVRGLKTTLENIISKLNMDKIYKRNFFINNIQCSKEFPLIITEQIIEDCLGDDVMTYKKIHPENKIGCVNGLYASEMCLGGIVPIQMIANKKGKDFNLIYTGNHKKIMKESIVYSFNTAINLLTTEGEKDFKKKYPGGLHIHTPEASTPKDGPSAGVAFTLTFLSIMLGLKINNLIALTGEIDLYGNVTKIGGIQQKIAGAFKAGVQMIFLPKENEKEYSKLEKENPELFDNNHKCFFINHVCQIAEKVLINFNSKKKLMKINHV
jgi:endopeptidase La